MHAKTIGGLSHINNSTLDGITQSKLFFSDDAVFDASDTVVTLDHITSSDMSSNEFRFDAVTAQYVRWEVTGISGGDTYQGSRYLRFHDDQEQGRLSMAMIGNHSRVNATTYNAIHAYDGIQSNPQPSKMNGQARVAAQKRISILISGPCKMSAGWNCGSELATTSPRRT